MEEIIQELIRLGLSDKEAAVYLAALELGSAVVSDIAEKAKINRATAYVIVESLMRHGLMSSAEKGKKRIFFVETPARLLTLVRERQDELARREHELTELLPVLNALYKVEGHRPQIRYFEGEEGMKTVRSIFLYDSGPIIQIVPYDVVQEFREVRQGQERHLGDLSAQGSWWRTLLVLQDPLPSEIPEVPNNEVRCIPYEMFPIKGEISVRGNSIYLFTYTSQVLSVIITSKELAETIRALFELAWRGAETFKNI